MFMNINKGTEMFSRFGIEIDMILSMIFKKTAGANIKPRYGAININCGMHDCVEGTAGQRSFPKTGCNGIALIPKRAR